jgi:hypothetical protein
MRAKCKTFSLPSQPTGTTPVVQCLERLGKYNEDVYYKEATIRIPKTVLASRAHLVRDELGLF